jgi:quinol monooxygenase YgiN
MVTVVVNHKVKNFNAWLPFFEKHADQRQKYGGRGAKVYRSADDPNNVTIVFEWKDRAAFEALGQSADLAEIMAKAGVLGPPTFTFLNQAGTYPV